MATPTPPPPGSSSPGGTLNAASTSSLSPAPAASPLTEAQLQLYNDAVQLLNKSTESTAGDVAPLKRVHELVLQQHGAGRSHTDRVRVLQQLLPDLIPKLQSATAAKLRLWLLDFLEATLRFDPAKFTPQILSVITSMTAEENAAVVKKVVSLGCTVFPHVYAWLLHHVSSWGVVHERVVAELAQMRSALLAMVDSPNEGVKPLVIKFMEGSILTLTNEKPSQPIKQNAANTGKVEMKQFTLRDLPPHHAVLDANKLRDEAAAILSNLLSFTPTIAATFSSLLKSLSALSKFRPIYTDRVIERMHELVELVLMEEAQLALLPSEQQVKRVRNDLKAALIDVLKNAAFTAANYQQQQTSLVQALTALGCEPEAKEVVKQQEKKKAQWLKQHQAAAAPTGSVSSAATAAASTPVPAVSYDFVASPDSPDMKLLAHHLSLLPSHSIVQLVMSSLNHFIPPPSSAAALRSGAREASSLFVQFVAACSTGLPQQAKLKTKAANVGERQQQQQAAEMALAQAAAATSTVTDAAAPTTPTVKAAPTPAVTRTVVPPVPVPELSISNFESLSRSAFARIASSRTQRTVERSGQSALRNVVLAKLSATNLLYPLHYTHTIDPELDPSDPAASSWQSSLLSQENHKLLMAYILRDFHLESGYECALNWLYCLLCVDTQHADIETKIKEKSKEEDEEEEHEPEAGVMEDADVGEEGETVDQDAEMKDESKVKEQEDGNAKEEEAKSSGTSQVDRSKRKREDDATAAATDTSANDVDVDEQQPDQKRARTEAGTESSTTAETSTTAAQLAASLAPSTLPSFAEHGTVEYAETLERLLTSLESSGLFGAATSTSRQHLFARFLLDIPLLTPAVFAALDRAVYDPARSVIGLTTLRDLILYRPPVQHACLTLLLGYTHKAEQSKLRNQATRLLVNHLYTPHEHLRDAIVEYASQLLDALADPRTLEDLPPIVVNVEVPPMPIYDKIQLPKLNENEQKDAAVKTERDPNAPTLSTAEQKDLKTRQEIQSLILEADRRKKEYDRLVFMRSLKEKEKNLLEQQRDERAKRRVDRLTRHMELYFSLCTRRTDLTRRVFKVFARCEPFVRQCMLDQARPLVIAMMHVDVDGFIQILEQETKDSYAVSPDAAATGSEALVLHCLQLMTAKIAPSAALVQAVMRMYSSTGSNPRYLIPILHGLPSDAIRRYLPRLITLPPTDLKLAFDKLLHSTPPANIKPSELLLQLHLIPLEPRKRTQPVTDPAQLAKERKEDEDALDKRVIGATKLCFDDPESFPADVLGVVLNQLSDHTPLPKLLMRTVMQSMMLHSSLRNFVVNTIMIKLITKHIYLQPVLWRGFIAAATMLLPASLPVLVQLPDQPFIGMMHDPSCAKLHQHIILYVTQYPMQVRRSIREIVAQIQQEQYMKQMQQKAMNSQPQDRFDALESR